MTRGANPLWPIGTARPTAEEWAEQVRWFERLAKGARGFGLEPATIALAHEIARLDPGRTDSDRRATAALILSLFAAERQGSTRLSVDGAAGGPSSLRGVLDDLVGLSREQGEGSDVSILEDCLERLTSGASALVGKPGEYRPLVFAPPFLALQRLFAAEERLARRLATTLERTATEVDAVGRAVAELADRPVHFAGRPILLSEEQLAAVRSAASEPFLVVTGGPGTGKTTIVVAILRALARIGTPMNEVFLAAPTGKAAYRLEEALAATLAALAGGSDSDRVLADVPAPRTLHRLLSYSPARRRFRHHENHPLAATVVIVDEGSMIDLVLMERLVRALPPKARLVLLGDAEQLPSVEAGAVFRDLVQALETVDPARLVRLRKSRRMDPSDPAGRAILSVAHRIQQGDITRLVDDEAQEGGIHRRASAQEVLFDRVELLAVSEPSERSKALAGFRERFLPGDEEQRRFCERVLPLDSEGAEWREVAAVAETLARARILCLTNVGPTGSDAVNEWFHRRNREVLGGSWRGDMLPGEPVLMLENDYDRGVFNGDQGLVVAVADSSGRRLAAAFPRGAGWAVVPLEGLRGRVRLGYAISVHKSQGSEFDHVLVLLPDIPMPIATREILYTAVTRSRKSVTIVGAETILEACVSRRLERSSGLAERLDVLRKT